MTATETAQFVEVSIKMRLGTSKDFKKEISFLNQDGAVSAKSVPNYGQPYWVKSQITEQFDNRNYQISEDTDWEEFKDFLRREMVYVPVGYFELKEAGAL